MTVEAESLPLRGPHFDMLVREYLVCSMSAAIAGFGTLGRATLFAAAALACGAYSPFGTQPRSVSVNALAASLRRPFETTRRTANWLIERGLLARAETGVEVPRSSLNSPIVRDFAAHCHDLLVRLIDDCAAAGLTLPPARDGIVHDPARCTALALDLLLAGLEHRDGDDRALIRIALQTVVDWMSQRRGCDGHARRASPIRPSMVARALDLPYATVARNLEAMVAAGRMTRMSNGSLASVAGSSAHDPLADRARQLIGRAAQAGLPTDRPAQAYLNARPPLPAME